jgi:hypothetical protein
MGIGQFKYGSPLPPLKREGNIIYFPGAWQGETPAHAGHSAVYEEPWPSFAEHCEAFKGVDFGGSPNGGRILWALYHNRIHGIEELVRTPAVKLLGFHYVGEKTLERIRVALESRGYTLGKDWNMAIGEEPHEG